MAKENKRIVVADGFLDQELVALAKLIGKTELEQARSRLKTEVYKVDCCVRVVGDIEVGIS